MKDNNENLELAGVGIFGGQGIPDGGNRRTSTIDGDYEDLEEANFGARQPGNLKQKLNGLSTKEFQRQICIELGSQGVNQD